MKWDHINFIKSTHIILCACLILTCAELSAEVLEVEGIDKTSGNVHVPAVKTKYTHISTNVTLPPQWWLL